MERDSGHWQARLPAELIDHVAWPVRVQSFHDDAVPASKWRGYDALGLLCYYRHVYSRWSTDFDDAGLGDLASAPCELQQQEELEAWRTLLGTWVRRVQRIRRSGGPGADGSPGGSVLVDTGFELVTRRAIPRL
jgi:hypothetical protein